jgi:hypothetical protein
VRQLPAAAQFFGSCDDRLAVGVRAAVVVGDGCVGRPGLGGASGDASGGCSGGCLGGAACCSRLGRHAGVVGVAGLSEFRAAHAQQRLMLQAKALWWRRPRTSFSLSGASFRSYTYVASG